MSSAVHVLLLPNTPGSHALADHGPDQTACSHAWLGLGLLPPLLLRSQACSAPLHKRQLHFSLQQSGWVLDPGSRTLSAVPRVVSVSRPGSAPALLYSAARSIAKLPERDKLRSLAPVAART